ncbi:hypothetical protein ACN47E_000524 [Coniothyrium glycines]
MRAAFILALSVANLAIAQNNPSLIVTSALYPSPPSSATGSASVTDFFPSTASAAASSLASSAGVGAPTSTAAAGANDGRYVAVLGGGAAVAVLNFVL